MKIGKSKGKRQRLAVTDAIEYEVARRTWAAKGKGEEFEKIQAAVSLHGWKKVYRDKILRQKGTAKVHKHMRAILRHMERLSKIAEVKNEK